MRKKKLGVARLWHEGNSFSPARTGAEEFRRREWVDPPAARAETGMRPDFVLTEEPNPHPRRARELLRRHPEVRELFGRYPASALWMHEDVLVLCAVSAASS